MSKKITMTMIALMLSGCSTVQNLGETSTNNQTSSYSEIDYGKNIFNADFSYLVKNKNTLNENISLLNKIEKNEQLMNQISKNKKIEDPYYEYYYNYIALQHKIIITKIDNKKIKEVNDEIAFLLNACKNSKLDIADELQNLAKENPNHFQSLNKEENKMIEECLYKEPIKEIKKTTVVVNNQTKKMPTKTIVKKENNVKAIKKETVVIKKEIIKKTKNEEYKSKYDLVKNKIDNNYFIIEAHCNEEDSYLLPNDIIDFKSKISDLVNDNDLETYIYKHYKKDIDECLVYYNSNKLLIDSDKKEDLNDASLKKITPNEDVNSKTLELVKKRGYDGYNFKESLNDVTERIFSGEANPEELLKELSMSVRVIDKLDNLLFFDEREYKGNKYYVFSNDKTKTQVYYPMTGKSKYKKSEELKRKYYYTVFDYGYIDKYKTLILNKVKL